MGTVRYTVMNGEVIAEKRNGVRSLYVPDPLGSTVALLDNTQTKTDTFSYWPYGERAGRTGTTATPFEYVGTLGYYKDTSARTYVRARHLSTQHTRWMTEDPIGFEGGDFNLYRYCLNLPTSLGDPNGLKPTPEPKCKEAQQIQAAIDAACAQIANSPYMNRLSPGLRDCMRDWCASNRVIKCGSSYCTAKKNVCAYTESGCNITLCTGIVGNVNSGCGIPGISNPTTIIGVTIIHEVTHCCGIEDHKKTWPWVPITGNNPAEDIGRGCFGAPGHMGAY